MAIVENSYSPKMGSTCFQSLDPKIWLSSEISHPKTWHAHPRMQTWQLPPWVSSQQCKILMCFYRNHFDSTPYQYICHFLAKTTQFGTDIWVFILDPHLKGQHLKMIMQISHSSEL